MAVSGLGALSTVAVDAGEECPQGLGLDAGAPKLSANGATGRGAAAGAGLLLAPLAADGGAEALDDPDERRLP